MNAAQVDCQHNSATRASSGGLLEAFALMYGSFNRSRSLLWAAAAPVAASLTAAVLALDTCTPSNTAGVGVAAALRRYTSPINLDTAFNGMLLGRGDPKTRKGKVSPEVQTCQMKEVVAFGICAICLTRYQRDH